MKRSVMTLTLICTIALLSTGCQQVLVKKCWCGPTGVFVHITHGADDAHAALMGLRMANVMAEDRKVLVYLDLRAVEIVLEDGPDLQLAPFDSSHAQLEALLKEGVPVYVCPGCLKAAGKKPADVRPGVLIAEKEAFFSFTKGRILTLDY